MPALNLYRLNANGSVTPMLVYVARGGAWRSIYLYELPAEQSAPLGKLASGSGFQASITATTRKTGTLTASFGIARTMVGAGQSDILGTASATFGFRGAAVADARKKGKLAALFGLNRTMSGSPVSNATTTVINITDLLVSGETLSATVNCTTAFTNCINRIVRRTGVVAAITTDHVTVDLEGTYWRVENPMAFPSDTMINNEDIYHFCQRWPKGVTIRNGGIQAVSRDGHTSGTGGTAVTTVNRNRYHLRIQQAVKRPSQANNTQWLEFDNFWIKGPFTYAIPYNYNATVLPREGQEAFYLSGAQWVRFVDCQIEQQFADSIFSQARDDVTNPATVHDDVIPGMIEILGGRFQRAGIMNFTMNTTCAPDAVIPANYWRNEPAYLDPPANYNSFPSASGQQYGVWWHGNAAHPFRSIDTGRSIIDIEPQGSYSPCQDVRIGADSNRNDFTFTHPVVGADNNFVSLGDDWGLIRRFTIRHVYRAGQANIGFEGSPIKVLDEHNQAVTTTGSGSNGQTLPQATINVASNANFPSSGRILISVLVAGNPIGSTIVSYTGKTSTSFTGCTGGVGTMATGRQVRNATVKAGGTTIAVGSNGVVLGAVGSSVAGTGVVNVVTSVGYIPAEIKFLRVWTDDGVAIIRTNGNKSPTAFNGCTVQVGTGFTLRTGQELTAAFTSPERLPYTIGDITVDDFRFTQPSQSQNFNVQRCDGYTCINCYGPYRENGAASRPFGDNQNVLNFNKGGTSQFGSNQFFPV